MEIIMFLKGIVLGLSIAIPVGPIGVLCIRRTLASGRLIGLVSGLGAATADGIYGCIAGFGLTFISQFLVAQAFWLQVIGGAFLCYLGIKNLGIKTPLAQPAETAAARGRGLIGAYTSTLLLTLTNPATILSFVAIFAGVGMASTPANYGLAAVLVMGVFLGSALWWLTLSWGVNRLRSRITPKYMQGLNRVSGLILLGFGLLALSLQG